MFRSASHVDAMINTASRGTRLSSHSILTQLHQLRYFSLQFSGTKVRTVTSSTQSPPKGWWSCSTRSCWRLHAVATSFWCRVASSSILDTAGWVVSDTYCFFLFFSKMGRTLRKFPLQNRFKDALSTQSTFQGRKLFQLIREVFENITTRCLHTENPFGKLSANVVRRNLYFSRHDHVCKCKQPLIALHLLNSNCKASRREVLEVFSFFFSNLFSLACSRTCTAKACST